MTWLNSHKTENKTSWYLKMDTGFYKLKIAPYAGYFLERGLHKYIEILSERTVIWS